MELNVIHNEDCRTGLQRYPDNFFHCCVTSPPYWGLRDYGVADQLGLERTPEEYVANMVQVFREVKRVLRDDGTLWLNIGDSYAHNGAAYGNAKSTLTGLKPKDLVGIPWMVAFALRADGWYLRQDVIWAKKNCMPESVKDRPTRSHEYIFLLTKSEKYYYDSKAIQEPAVYDIDGTGTAARKERQKDTNKSIPSGKIAGIRPSKKDKQRGHSRRHSGFNDRWDNMSTREQCTGMRNKRDVWHMPTAQFSEGHFATFPEELPHTCILAGCPDGGNVLDPFMGAGTTGMVARKLQRNYVGFELNTNYVAIAERRLRNELGMFL
jgi:DNA modification methylase